MSLKVRWTRRALRRLDQIALYIAQDSPLAAERIVTQISARVARLCDQPTMGRIGRIAGTREFVVTGTPYIVAYRVHLTDLEVITVFHGAQRWPDSF
jgi:addiction module RelE/StbE family toxin